MQHADRHRRVRPSASGAEDGFDPPLGRAGEAKPQTSGSDSSASTMADTPRCARRGRLRGSRRSPGGKIPGYEFGPFGGDADIHCRHGDDLPHILKAIGKVRPFRVRPCRKPKRPRSRPAGLLPRDLQLISFVDTNPDGAASAYVEFLCGKKAAGMTSPQWGQEFARVISCASCTTSTCSRILRDAQENVAQPGYVGAHDNRTRLLLVGQNPHRPAPSLAADDRIYMAALRTLRDDPGEEAYSRLATVLARVIPLWPIHNRHFPLRECGLGLDDIAFCNLVRCRTSPRPGDGGSTAPNAAMTRTCLRTHFEPWLDRLEPRCIVFIGAWARRRAEAVVASRQIPFECMDGNRSLDLAERADNARRVAGFVRSHIGP